MESNNLKEEHRPPETYRIIFRAGRWKTKSKRFFPAWTAQQAFDDFYHTFITGHIHARSVKVFKVERYDRFADRWYDQMDQVVDIPADTAFKKKGNITIKHNDKK